MKIFRYQSIITIVVLGLMFASCSQDDDENQTIDLPRLTLVASTGGMGDNGYNDLIFDGIMEFVTKNEVTFSIISPKDRQEAQTAVSDWCNENTGSKQSLLVLASSEYESLLDGNIPELKASKSILLLKVKRKSYRQTCSRSASGVTELHTSAVRWQRNVRKRSCLPPVLVMPRCNLPLKVSYKAMRRRVDALPR